MLHSWRRRSVPLRLVFVAALTLAGVGAGVAAAFAASSNGLIRAVAGAAGGVAGLIAATWIDLARGRKEAAEAAEEERARVLDPVVSSTVPDSSVFGVLLPTRPTAAPFRGRTSDLAWLAAWCDQPGRHPVAIVAGAAGVGKTRLVTQFALRRPEPWAAGWLHPGCGTAAVAAVRACGDPALIMVDDAESSPDVSALLNDLAGHPGALPVRVVLISRTVSAVRQVADRLTEPNRWILASDNTPVLQVGPFGSIEDRARWFSEAVRAYAAARHTPPPDLPMLTSAEVGSAPDEPLLTLHAQALLAVLDSERRRPQRPALQEMPFEPSRRGSAYP